MNHGILETFEFFWVMFSSEAASALYRSEYHEGYPGKMLITGELYLPLLTFLVVFFVILYLFIKVLGNPITLLFKGFLLWKGIDDYTRSQRSVFVTTFVYFVPLSCFIVIAVEGRYRVNFFLDFGRAYYYDLSYLLFLLSALFCLLYPIFAWFIGVRKFKHNKMTDFMDTLFVIADEINKARAFQHPIQTFTWRGLWGKLTHPK